MPISSYVIVLSEMIKRFCSCFLKKSAVVLVQWGKFNENNYYIHWQWVTDVSTAERSVREITSCENIRSWTHDGRSIFSCIRKISKHIYFQSYTQCLVYPILIALSTCVYVVIGAFLQGSWVQLYIIFYVEEHLPEDIYILNIYFLCLFSFSKLIEISIKVMRYFTNKKDKKKS